jgi:hypothetical protein
MELDIDTALDTGCVFTFRTTRTLRPEYLYWSSIPQELPRARQLPAWWALRGSDRRAIVRRLMGKGDRSIAGIDPERSCRRGVACQSD